MPRPKVKPQDRQRSARACLPCKASKIRCDAVTPCGPCLKRERVSACVYLESSRKRQKTQHATETSPFPTPSIEDASPQFEPSPVYEDGQGHVPPTAPVAPMHRTADMPSAAATVATTPSPEPGKASHRLTQSRMLLSSKGEKLYVGENASLSFLQFLRQILKKYMGPSAFTENQFRDNMLEVEMARDESPPDSSRQSRGEKLTLVQLYREASSGILDMFTVDEIHGFLDRHDALSPSITFGQDDKSSRAEQASLNMMLAIGSQCRGQSPFDSYNAARHFTSAQKYAFEGYLCDPTLDMVRVFLLMAFYMLGACHRNAAFMYLGIASKAACALGLHRREPSKAMSPKDYIMRWRTWKSLLILDTIVSSILGRPGGLPSLRPNQEDSIYDGNEAVSNTDKPRWLSSQAVFTICSHIIELEQQIGNGKIVDGGTAEAFLSRLRKWNDTLPQELRHFASLRDTQLAPADRELFIGSVHVACTYYFTIILVTRPFLISHLITQLRRQRVCDGTPITSKTEPSHVSDLAQACLDAAMYMAKTGHMAITSMLLSNNMCLLKAWMFASGLLLGFAMFAQPEPVLDIEEAFQNAIAVLERLAQYSPQARHYFEILTTFSDAIHNRREQLGRERRKKSDRFVSQIFTASFHDPNQNSQPLPTPSTGCSNVDPALDQSSAGGLDGINNFDFDFNNSSYDLSSFSDSGGTWTDMPLMSDNLYIDWESLLPVMDS